MRDRIAPDSVALTGNTPVWPNCTVTRPVASAWTAIPPTCSHAPAAGVALPASSYDLTLNVSLALTAVAVAPASPRVGWVAPVVGSNVV